MKLRKRDLFLLVAAPAMLLGTVGILGGVNASLAPTEVQANYDATTHKDAFDFKFSTIGSDGWSNGYGKHSVESDVGKVTFAGASKQTSNIKDYPVNKNEAITYTLKNLSKYTITAVKLECQQWTTKTQTIGLKTSADGTNFTALSSTSTNFTLDVSGLSAKAVEFTFTESNQIGIKALTVTLASTAVAKKTVTLVTNCEQTIDQFEVDEGGKISSIEGADSLSKKGYHLDGWTTDEKWRNKWHFDTDVVTEDVTLYADWVKDNAAEYTLTFDTDKGSAAPAAQTVKEDHYFSTVAAPTKNGDDLYDYVFAGWYEKDENAEYLSEAFDFDAKATKNVDLFAKWEQVLAIESETFYASNKTQASLAFSYTATTSGESTEVETSFANSDLQQYSSAGNHTATYQHLSLSWNGVNSDELRVYKGQSLTISSSDGNIKSIAFTCTANGDSKYGPGCFTLNAGGGTYTPSNGATGTWNCGSNAGNSVTFLAETNQVRIVSMTVVCGDSATTTYSNFENAKLQFRYDYNSFEQNQKSKIKKATEMGLFITDDENFDFSSKPTTLDVAEGKIGKKYHNVEGKDFDLTVGIVVPEEKYDVNLYAAAYLLMPNGKYYFNKPEHYSVNSILQQYAYGNVLTDETQKAICVAFATSLGLTANN